MKFLTAFLLCFALLQTHDMVCQTPIVQTVELDAPHLEMFNSTDFIAHDYHPMGFTVSLGTLSGWVGSLVSHYTFIEAKTPQGATLWRKYISAVPNPGIKEDFVPLGITTVKSSDVFLGLNPNTSIVVMLHEHTMNEPQNLILIQLDHNGNLVATPGPGIEVYPYSVLQFYPRLSLHEYGNTLSSSSTSRLTTSYSLTAFSAICVIQEPLFRTGLAVHLSGSLVFQNFFDADPNFDLTIVDHYYDYKCGRLYVCGSRRNRTTDETFGVVMAFNVDKNTNLCNLRWTRYYQPTMDVDENCGLSFLHPIVNQVGDIVAFQLLGEFWPDQPPKLHDMWTMQIDVSGDCELDVPTTVGDVLQSYKTITSLPGPTPRRVGTVSEGLTLIPNSGGKYVYSAFLEDFIPQHVIIEGVLGVMDGTGAVTGTHRVDQPLLNAQRFGSTITSELGEKSHHANSPLGSYILNKYSIYTGFYDNPQAYWVGIREDGLESDCFLEVLYETLPHEVEEVGSFALSEKPNKESVPGIYYIHDPEEVVDQCSTCVETPSLLNKYHHGSYWSMGFAGSLLDELPDTTEPEPLGMRRLVTGYVHGTPYSYEDPPYNYAYNSDIPIIVDNGSGVYNDFVRKGVSTDVVGAGSTEEERKANSSVNNDIAYSSMAVSEYNDVLLVGTRENKGMSLSSFMKDAVGDRNLLAISVNCDNPSEGAYNVFTLNWAVEIGRKTSATPNGARSIMDYEKFTGKSLYSTVPVTSQCVEEGRSVSVWPSLTVLSDEPPFDPISLAPSILVAGFSNTSYADTGCTSHAALNGLVAELDMSTGAVNRAFKHIYGGTLWGDSKYLTSDVLLDQGSFATANSSGAVLAGYRRSRQPGQSWPAESASNRDYGIITTVSRDLSVLASRQLLFTHRTAPNHVAFTRYARIHDVAVIHGGASINDDQIIAVGTCFYAGAGGSPDVFHSFIVSFDKDLNVLWSSVFNIGNSNYSDFASSVNIIESSTAAPIIQVVGRCRTQSADPESGEEDRMYIVRYNEHGAVTAWQLFNDAESHSNARPYDVLFDEGAEGTYICGGIDRNGPTNNADLGDCGTEGALFQISGGGCFEEQYCELGTPRFVFQDIIPILSTLNPSVEEMDEFQSISATIYNLNPVGFDGDCGDHATSEIATKRICPTPPSAKW